MSGEMVFSAEMAEAVIVLGRASELSNMANIVEE